MKKVFIPILAALFIGLSFSSCSKDEYVLESTTTRTTDYSVTWDRWNPAGSDYLYHTLDWYVLTTNVLSYGNVDVYLYEGDDVNGWEQHKLPYIQTILDPTDNTYNGAGKTTSIGKIASKMRKEGKRVLIAAGDTFRAAAVEQLEEWARRAGCDVVKGKENQDPSSVIFDACKKAKEENYDVLICDTAGRLQNKKYLMDELKKMKKIIDREMEQSSKETILVLDGSVGQNAISQVESFKECTGLTGLIITKLDGTGKGGIVIRLYDENKIPIKFIGVGEKIDDMEVFDSKDFINAIIE